MLPMISRFNDQNWFPSLFNDFFNDNDFWMTNRKNSATEPAVNVIDNEKEYKVEIAAPGMTKEDFQVSVDKYSILHISLEKKTESNEEDKQEESKEPKYLRREFCYTKFQQSFSLPDDVAEDRISAKMTDGVLTIDIPKKEAAPVVDATRQIAIS